MSGRQMRWIAAATVFTAVGAATACGDDETPPPPTDASATACTTDDDCNDGTFCNGLERCLPGASGGTCITGRACFDGQRCEEAARRCVTLCDATEDADGDGVAAFECSGTDCDDTNPARFPGNAEVCDADGADEDCDPSTFGFRDADMDGFADASCCNGEPGAETCGTDCDDARPATSPTGAEVCDTLDNDCDGLADEMAPGMTFYADVDRDGFGDPSDTVMECLMPEGRVDRAGDCDDGDAAVHESAVEACDGVDQNCSNGGGVEPLEDADADGHGAASAPCEGGTLALDDCDDDEAARFPGNAERCDTLDNDCSASTLLDDDCASGALVGGGSSTSLRGGDTGSSNYFCEDPGFPSCGPGCPPGMQLVGLTLDVAGSDVRRVSGLCREMDVALVPGMEDTYRVAWGTVGSVAPHGASAGTSTGTSQCPTDEWVVGIHGNADASHVASLGVVCGRIAIAGSRAAGYTTATTFTSLASARGGPGGTSFDDRCPANRLIGGYEGFVDGLDGTLASIAVFCGSSSVQRF